VAVPAPIVVLNGAPRSGKSSIAAALGDPWVNVGVDLFGRSVVPRRLRPGIGLRPGGERPDLEPLLPAFYGALCASVAAHSRMGRPVVVDVGIHDAHGRPLGTHRRVAAWLDGLPVLLVGVRCPLGEVMRRRDADPGSYVTTPPGGGIPDPVRRWEAAVHMPGAYDLEVDTSVLTPARCAEAIRRRLEDGPPGTALAVWADRGA
jgi:chloramphenicol 3-O phosphotransferase